MEVMKACLYRAIFSTFMLFIKVNGTAFSYLISSHQSNFFPFALKILKESLGYQLIKNYN